MRTLENKSSQLAQQLSKNGYTNMNRISVLMTIATYELPPFGWLVAERLSARHLILQHALIMRCMYVLCQSSYGMQ